MRITLNDEEIFELKRGNVEKSLLEKIEIEENKETSPKLLKGIKKARTERTKEVKKKIEAAINLLMFENKKLSVYAVAKKAGVSYNTVNKYDEIKKIIEDNEKIRVMNNKNSLS